MVLDSGVSTVLGSDRPCCARLQAHQVKPPRSPGGYGWKHSPNGMHMGGKKEATEMYMILEAGRFLLAICCKVQYTIGL